MIIPYNEPDVLLSSGLFNVKPSTHETLQTHSFNHVAVLIYLFPLRQNKPLRVKKKHTTYFNLETITLCLSV